VTDILIDDEMELPFVRGLEANKLKGESNEQQSDKN